MNSDLGTLDTRLRPWVDWLLRYASYYGLQTTVTSVRRSVQLQAKLYQDYLAGRSRLPAAPPGRSKHQLGLAVDIVVQPQQYQSWLGSVWKSVGGKWYASDPVHFEV